MLKTLSLTFPLSKKSVKSLRDIQKSWSIWLSRHRRISESEKVLAVIMIAVFVMNPLAATVGAACWLFPLLLILGLQAKNLRNLGTPILANVFMTGALVAWDHGFHSEVVLNLAMAGILCILMVYFFERLRWVMGLPVFLAPAIVTLAILRSLNLVGPSSFYDFHQLSTTLVTIAAGIILSIYSPLSALMIGLGLAISVAVSSTLPVDAVIASTMVFLIIMTAATLPSFLAMG